ncbi:MAG: DUF305 domain-containing protein [Actinomycetota bacterium]|nr:DUF305 domain-containing protein [Actinomycetota bacterium]
MKTLLMKAWLLAPLLLTVAFLLAACGGGGNKQETSETTGSAMAGMNHMEHGSMGMGSKSIARQMVMENGKYSDRRFIDAMVPHHQGAIAMAKVALKNAEHEEIKQLSSNIISSQRAEIEELKAIKKEEFGRSQVPMEMSPQQMRGMGMMMVPEQLAHSEPFDKEFIGVMIPHHQSAIEMANVALENTSNPRIRELANNIVDAQRREIEQMEEWREEWYQEG